MIPQLDEYKAGYGKTLITGYARIDGWACRNNCKTSGASLKLKLV